MVDLVIRNGTVVTPRGRFHGGLAVQDRRIVAVGADGGLPPAHRVIDAGDRYVLPGLIDAHVHMASEEDASIAEGLRANMPRETEGALYGGVTTFGHFVGMRNEPLQPNVRATIEHGNRWSHVDYFLHAILSTEEHFDEQPALWALGAVRDTERLWRAFHDGGITCLGSDHGTGGRTRPTKEKGGGRHQNIWCARSGNRGGLEHFLPVLMTSGVAAGRLSMEDVVRVGAENTARVFGLYPRKGVLAPGADADVVIVDPDLEATVDDAFYHCLCEVSIYRGQKFRGLSWTTIVRGRVMMEARQTVGAPGWGRHVPRGAA